MRHVVLDGHEITEDGPCYVIAELGANHGGSVDTARHLIAAASVAGADAVKFQKRDNATLYSRALLDAPYANEHSFGPTYGAHRSALEFTAANYASVANAAKDHHITWFATAFDEASVDFLVRADVPAIKISSGGLTDHALLRYAASAGRPILLSTGGGTLPDIQRAVASLDACPHAILHCTASYPLSPPEANLRVIPTLLAAFPDTIIGWSTHHPGIALSLVAYTLGARIIEQHFTLNRAGKGTDHGFSLEAKGLDTLVDDLDKVRQALGDGTKVYYDSERQPLAKMRRVHTVDGWQIIG
jgi:sialic acid synthase